MNWITRTGLVAVAALGAGAFLNSRPPAAAANPTPGGKVSCYQDSMHPWIKSDKPGKCTICSMDLTPVMEGASLPVTGSDGVVLKRGGVKAVSVRTHEVRRGALTRTLRVTGTLEPNEKSKTVVSAPSAGRIQSTSVGALGEPVTKGASLATLFSPDLVQKRFFLRSVGGDQSGIGRGLFDMAALNAINDKMYRALGQVGGRIDALFYCPHAADAGCECRKPKPGMLRQIAAHYATDLAGTWFVGDTGGDLQAALAVDCQPVLVKTGKGERTLAKPLPPGTLVFDDLAAVADQLLS